MAIGTNSFSIWCDFVERDFLKSELPSLIDSGVVSGVTSNPVIFKNALLTSGAYDADKKASIRLLPIERYGKLAIEDITNAAKLLLPIHQANENDGFVSIEVNPLWAHDAKKMTEEAEKLYKQIGLPNIMIKIPATEEGYETIKDLVIQGINVNATLVFSPLQAGKCLQAIENGFYIFQRRNPKKSFPKAVISVFVSRFDRKIDKALEEAGLEKLKFGIMNASYIYNLVREQKISNVRCLFASTGVSDSSVKKSYYITKLLYKNAVNTAPLNAIESFMESLDADERACPTKDEIQEYFSKVEKAGLNTKEIYESLLSEGLEQFNSAFKEMLESLKPTEEELEEIEQEELEEREKVEEQALMDKIKAKEEEQKAKVEAENRAKEAAESARKAAEAFTAARKAREESDRKAKEEAEKAKAARNRPKLEEPKPNPKGTMARIVEKDDKPLVSVNVDINKDSLKKADKQMAKETKTVEEEIVKAPEENVKASLLSTHEVPAVATLRTCLRRLVEYKGSDLHVKSDAAVKGRVNGEIITVDNNVFTRDDVEILAQELLQDRYDEFTKKKNIDFVYKLDTDYRFRVNMFYQTDGISAAFRVIPINLPTIESMELPEVIGEFAAKRRGLVLVTGPTGCGKSTTLAAVINLINQTSQRHIITIEDPIEFIYKDEQSIINQRSVGQDAVSFADALIASLREDPDVIMVGEMRDIETIRTAIRAAETGHLVFSTLHTLDAKETIGRIISMFSGNEQAQIRQSLSSVLQAVVSQRLVRRKGGSGRTAAVEILIKNARVEAMIAQGREHEIKDAMEDDRDIYKSQSFNQALLELYIKGVVSYHEALYAATSPADLKIMLDNYDIKKDHPERAAKDDDDEEGRGNINIDISDVDILALKD